MRAVRTCSASNPRGTLSSVAKLFRRRPAPTSSTTATPTWHTTRARRTCARAPGDPPRLPSFKASPTWTLDSCTAGTTPNSTVVTSASPPANTSTSTLSDTSPSRGSASGPVATMTERPPGDDQPDGGRDDRQHERFRYELPRRGSATRPARHARRAPGACFRRAPSAGWPRSRTSAAARARRRRQASRPRDGCPRAGSRAVAGSRCRSVPGCADPDTAVRADR